MYVVRVILVWTEGKFMSYLSSIANFIIAILSMFQYLNIALYILSGPLADDNIHAKHSSNSLRGIIIKVRE
jgi:hypothetical protein